MSAAAPTLRRPVRVVLVLLLPVALVAGLIVWHSGGLNALLGRGACTVERGDTTVRLDVDQVQHASTIATVALADDLPMRAVTIALATAMQESQLRNLPGGDHDSAGLFQQRPSQGWGSFDEVTDPVHASQAFFGALLTVHRWQQLPLTQAAQAVQRSAYPDAYEQHADEARALAAALTGRRAGALSCTVPVANHKPQKLDATGLTPRATQMRSAMEAAWGPQSLGGFAPGGVERANPSAHNEGRAMDVFFEPYDEAASRQRGWAMAHWLVANASALDVTVVIYRDQIWSARHSAEGWRDYVTPFGDPNEIKSDPTLRHLDHVHVEVA